MPITGVGTATQQAQLGLAINYLATSSPIAADMLRGLDLMIQLNNTGTDSVRDFAINWDPTSGLGVKGADGSIGVQSPALGLMHEIVHFLKNQLTGNNEALATQIETAIANEMGEPTRASYESTVGPIVVQAPTEHTEGDHWVIVLENGTKLNMGPFGTVIAPPPEGGGGGGGGGNEGGSGGGWEGGDPYVPPHGKTPGGYWQTPEPEQQVFASYPAHVHEEIAIVGLPGHFDASFPMM